MHCVRLHQNVRSLSTALTSPGTGILQYKPGDLTSLTSFKGEVYPVVVIPNAIADENHLVSLFSSSGRITYSSSQFLRFTAKSFIDDAGILESKDRLQVKIHNFSNKTQTVFKENFDVFTEMSKELLRDKKFIYEEDLENIIFNNDSNDIGEDSISNRFAIHKFLFQGHDWIKDGQWSVGPKGSGPFIYRPLYQVNLLSKIGAIKQVGFDVESFRGKVKKLINDQKLFGLDFNESEILVLKCLKVFSNEYYLNALPTVPNPFRSFVKDAFLGVAILDTQTDAKRIMEKIQYDNIMRKEEEKINLPISKPFNNSYLIDDKDKDMTLRVPNILTEISSDKRIHDFMDMPVYLIDPLGTTEVDDGISLEYDVKDANVVKLHVHTADPSDFIKFNDEVDQIARMRAESLYLCELKKSMLPKQITNQSTLKLDTNSLNSPVTPLNTLTFSCTVDMDNGNISNHQIRRGIIKNLKHMTYEEAEVISTLENENVSDLKLKSDMNLLKKVAKAHLKFRKEGGYLDFSYPKGIARITSENEIVVDIDNGISAQNGGAFEAVSLKGAVAEAMIIAGRIAGEYLRERKVVGPFRYHPGITGGLDQLKKDPSLMSLLEKSELLKKIPTGAVDSHPRPHLSMGIEAYVKVTSPLRRYLDLVTHHILKKEIDSKPCEYGKDWFMQHLYLIHRQEQYNRKLSGAVNKYWIEQYLQRMKSTGRKELWSLVPLEKIRDDIWNVHIEEIATNFIVQVKSKSVGSLTLGESIPARFITKGVSSILLFEL